MDWKQLREAMNHMSDWYVKIYINSQQVGRFPMLMRALAEGENVVIAPPQPPAPPADPKKEGEAPAQPATPTAAPKNVPEAPAK